MSATLKPNPYRREEFEDPIPMPISFWQYALTAAAVTVGLDIVQSVGEAKIPFEQAMAVHLPYSLVVGALGVPIRYSYGSPYTGYRIAMTITAAFWAEDLYSPIIAAQYPSPPVVKEQKLEQAPDPLIRNETIQEFLRREPIDQGGKTAYFREGAHDTTTITRTTRFGTEPPLTPE